MADSLYVKVGDSVEQLDLGQNDAPEYVERIEALEANVAAQAAKDAEQDEAIAEALDKVGLPLGFEYTRLTGQNALLGGVDYMGQTATRAMYADLWAWLNENKPDAIVSEEEWQGLASAQNGDVAKYSSGDGSTTFRFPRVVGYLMGVIAFGSVASIGEATEEGIVAELGEHGAKLGEHGAKLGELEAAIEAFHDNCVGEIFSWPADSEPYRALPINGAAVSRTTYAKLFAKIGTKYGAGDGSTTFNVPNGIGKFLQCDNTAGTVKAAGLPNITGAINNTGRGTSASTASGAFATANVSQSWTGHNGDSGYRMGFTLNASRSSSIYGASTTVQPPALTMRYYIKY